MKYEDLPKKDRKHTGVDGNTNGDRSAAIKRLIPSTLRKVSGLAVVRLLQRVRRIEDQLQFPWLHDDNGLDEFIRMIVREENARRKK